MKSISEDLVASLEAFPDVPPAMVRTLRYMKSRVYEDGVRPIYLPAWKEVAESLQSADEATLFVPDYVFRGPA
jgi:hypothetical protein